MTTQKIIGQYIRSTETQDTRDMLRMQTYYRMILLTMHTSWRSLTDVHCPLVVKYMNNIHQLSQLQKMWTWSHIWNNLAVPVNQGWRPQQSSLTLHCNFHTCVSFIHFLFINIFYLNVYILCCFYILCWYYCIHTYMHACTVQLSLVYWDASHRHLKRSHWSFQNHLLVITLHITICYYISTFPCVFIEPLTSSNQTVWVLNKNETVECRESSRWCNSSLFEVPKHRQHHNQERWQICDWEIEPVPYSPPVIWNIFHISSHFL